MAQQRLGIIMNGVTGRMGTNQHLVRSIVAIRAQGGVALKNGDRVMPDPILVGRDAGKLEKQAIPAGKHIYCEKPITETLKDALSLAKAAKKAKVKNGVVQDKIFLP